jgi:formylglycine-generating enzyme required for sulfatase activity
VLDASVNDTMKGVTWRAPGHPVTAESPVSQVTWNDATAFCDWLSRAEKVTYRLPTEAEWEFACRAGTTTLFWCGDDPVQLAQAERCGGGGNPQSVGMMRPNPFGLFDMHGNVNEWCQDVFDMKWYEKSPAEDPLGTASGTWRVVRGGFATVNAAYCRSAYRNQTPPATRHSNTGFRVVCLP